ncbi:hypothetical protein BV372_00325 [Nostoc sp. T09]|uniref:Uma2 family endonuclease n=1 Tax=Nostoc sp. T09 TaxID=1932621 RepID=UPI000A38439F|nr:Uma2 family endonuclease [Nostoc sp. T09]OUL37837.1 hypothetical protein BV372_00325 [Nostoc sp. T09]
MIAIQNRLWTVEEYHRMIDVGILTPDDKVELLDGRIIQMSPQTPPHAATTQRIDRYLQNIVRDRAEIRVQLPITLSTSEPEPDIAVVRIDPAAYGDHHPTSSEILLLIEVSYSTFDIDFNEKALIYARAGIGDYWILNILECQVYILRHPTESGYQDIIVRSPDAAITPLAFPEIAIPFSELFLP